MNRQNFIDDEASGNLKLDICPTVNCNCGTLIVTFNANSSRPVEFELNIHSWDFFTDDEDKVSDTFHDILGMALNDDEVRRFFFDRYFEMKREQAATAPMATPYRFRDFIFAAHYAFAFPFDEQWYVTEGQSKFLIMDAYSEKGSEWHCILRPTETAGEDPISPVMYHVDREKRVLNLLPLFRDKALFSEDELLELVNEQIPDFWELIERRYAKLKAAYDKYMESDDLDDVACPYCYDDELDDDFDDEDDSDEDYYPVKEMENIFDQVFSPSSPAKTKPHRISAGGAISLHEQLQPVLTGLSPGKIPFEIDFAAGIPDRTEIHLLIENGGEPRIWRTQSLRELFRGNRPNPQFPSSGAPPDEYEFYFTLTEGFISSYCHIAGVTPSDDEFIEVFSAIRRRPDGKRINKLHDAIWQIAALLLGLFPLSQAKFEAIFLRLEQSARHVKALSRISSNYLHMINDESERMRL